MRAAAAQGKAAPNYPAGVRAGGRSQVGTEGLDVGRFDERMRERAKARHAAPAAPRERAIAHWRTAGRRSRDGTVGRTAGAYGPGEPLWVRGSYEARRGTDALLLHRQQVCNSSPRCTPPSSRGSSGTALFGLTILFFTLLYSHLSSLSHLSHLTIISPYLMATVVTPALLTPTNISHVRHG